MIALLMSTLTQALTFLPLALGISISYNLLRATDMTIDGSFVVGAAVFARIAVLGYSPLFAFFVALLIGACAGILAAAIQRGGRVDPLLAGVLAAFILSSINLIIMARPNINLLTQPTLLSSAFAHSEWMGLLATSFATLLLALIAYCLMSSRFGLILRAFGDNPLLLHRLGKRIEMIRFCGFAFTNMLAASAGCLTAQVVGYADINMGFGMTLTGIGAIILGQQCLSRLYKTSYFRIKGEFFAAFVGVLIYFFAINLLLRLNVNPIYLKMLLGIILVIFLRSALKPTLGNKA